MELTDFPRTHINWTKAFRIIPARYPPVRVFDRLTNHSGEADTLAEIESMTNPQARQERGAISIIAEADRVTGPGASLVMAPFIHTNPNGSRFSAGRFGVCYAADRLGTAVQESCTHLGRFYKAAGDPPHAEDMRVLVGRIQGRFRDLVSAEPCRDPADYQESQKLAEAVYLAGEDGILYPSIRNPGYQAIAAFRPRTVGIPVPERHLKYHWDGTSVSRIFDYQWEKWVARDVFV